MRPSTRCSTLHASNGRSPVTVPKERNRIGSRYADCSLTIARAPQASLIEVGVTRGSAYRPLRRRRRNLRNGTQCLFACLKIKQGDVLAMPPKTRNRWDLIRFLDMLDAEIPVVEAQEIVAVSDNLSTRGTKEVQQWLEDHPRWRFQFTPTHASWLN